MPNLIVIDTLLGIQSLREYLKDKEYVAYDCETTGLSRQSRIIGFSVCAEDDKAFYVILEKWDNNLIPMPYLNEAREIIEDLSKKQLIMHNAIFDAMMAEAYFKINLIQAVHTDTMILAHLLDENRRVGLKELGKSLFGENAGDESEEVKASVIKNGGKTTKTNYEMYKCDSYIMGKYGAKDALLTYRLFYTLVPQLLDAGLDKFFYEEESMPLLRGPTYDLNTTGLTIDIPKLIQLKKILEAECEEGKAFIYKEIHNKIKDLYPGTNKKNTFNIDAPQQLSWLLFEIYGLEFGTLTKAGKNLCKTLGMKLPYTRGAKNSFIHDIRCRKGQIFNGKKIRDPWVYICCDKKTLQKLMEKYKWIEELLKYQKRQKLLNTYVLGIEERIEYGIIRPSYLQHGTTTGRYASRNPNLQNLPRDDQRIKDCFIARPGKIFVSADFSQLEPRIFSYYSQDPKLLSAFDGTSDFYSVIGMEVFNKYDCEPQKEGPNSFGIKYKKLRDLAKVIALASAYGATPHQLAPTTNKSVEETAEDMQTYFERFPGVRKMMIEAHDLAKDKGFVTNLFGRIRHIPDARYIPKKREHWDLPYEARKLLNMACNFRIQSTGASIVNRAAIRFYNDCKDLNIEAKVISQIHDELVIECNESDAQAVSLLLQNAMENTTQLPGIKLEAIPRITQTLKKA